MFKPKWRAALLLALLLVSLCTVAHRYHAAISSIERDANSGALEIEHRLFMHDLEAILQQMTVETINLDDAEGEKLIRHYIETHFALLDAAMNPISLQWVGLELDQTYATVYQEASSISALKTLYFRNQLLSEIPEQVNTLNLNDGSERTSLVFTATRQTLSWSY